MSLTAGSEQRSLRVLTSTSEHSRVAAHAGGKGANLHALTAAGFRVPDWSVIGLDVFAEFSRDSGLDERLADLFGDGWQDRAGEVAAEAAGLIATAHLGNGVAAAVAA
ncbi:hypothetical protein ABZ590_27020, partial [Streptomyces hirsutus]|uniref:hypothetical protein n=1 Tax=Streptomyces hirsutus TaxID=35620 RepID=UPI0033F23932